MFLVDKYYNEYNNMLYDTNHVINNYFDYNNNFQHLILYGPSGSNKKFIVNKILENIYGKNEIEVKDIEYTITGYTNINIKVLIKQSKNHLVIEPNSNGFDKYLIQEIIQNYAKSQVLNIIKSRKLFKIIVINKVYNLSYYAQASLRRTMEKYSNICKFILISDQLSTVIEPLRSRCLLIRVSLYSNSDILNILLYISYKEKINIDFKNINNIIVKSENIINHAIWLLEMYKYNVDYNKNWENIISKIVLLIINIKNKQLLNIIMKIRKYFYILFITNISSSLIIKKIMNKLLCYTYDIKKRYEIINITSIYNERLLLGSRHIVHIESYIIKLFELFY